MHLTVCSYLLSQTVIIFSRYLVLDQIFCFCLYSLFLRLLPWCYCFFSCCLLSNPSLFHYDNGLTDCLMQAVVCLTQQKLLAASWVHLVLVRNRHQMPMIACIFFWLVLGRWVDITKISYLAIVLKYIVLAWPPSPPPCFVLTHRRNHSSAASKRLISE